MFKPVLTDSKRLQSEEEFVALVRTFDYYMRLPKKRMGAGALIFNTKGEVLLVKPTYKGHWSIPGGTVDENESPRHACIREIKEEIGLDITSLTFLCVDYTPAIGDKNEAIQFAFYGGTLTDIQISSIHLQEEELCEFRFVSVDEAVELTGGHMRNLAKRIPKCIDAIKTGTAVYLENGEF